MNHDCPLGHALGGARSKGWIFKGEVPPRAASQAAEASVPKCRQAAEEQPSHHADLGNWGRMCIGLFLNSTPPSQTSVLTSDQLRWYATGSFPQSLASIMESP